MHFLIFGESLVGVEQRAETVLDAEDVVVDCVQVWHWVVDAGARQTQDTVGQCRRHDQAEGIETREVEGAGGLELRGVEAIADDCHIRQLIIVDVSVGCVVVLSHIHPVEHMAGVADIHAVHLRLELVVGSGC